MIPESHWYEDAFDRTTARVYAHRNLEAARTEARFLVEQGIAGQVLDLCCGFARHSLALSELGVKVFGLDLSFDLLRDARQLPGYALLAGRLLRADAGRLPFTDDCFDSLVNLFSSFGYFGERGDARMLDEIERVLRPGGCALLDLMNPSAVRASLKPETQREGDDYRLHERRALLDGGRRITKEVELRVDGSVRRWREDVRMYEEHEMRTHLGARGLAVDSVWGDFDGSALTASSPRMILRAHRQ